MAKKHPLEFGQKEESAAYGPGRAKMPASSFLLPSEKKFPYKTPDGRVSTKLLMAAYKRARQYGYTNVASKALRLLKKQGYEKADGLSKEE
jgi:hypothetical protein